MEIFPEWAPVIIIVGVVVALVVAGVRDRPRHRGDREQPREDQPEP